MHGHHHHRRRREVVREDSNGERTTTRVQLEMPPQAMERLQRLKEKTEAASYAEVIRSALRLFEALVEEHERRIVDLPLNAVGQYRMEVLLDGKPTRAYVCTRCLKSGKVEKAL